MTDLINTDNTTNTKNQESEYVDLDYNIPDDYNEENFYSWLAGDEELEY